MTATVASSNGTLMTLLVLDGALARAEERRLDLFASGCDAALRVDSGCGSVALPALSFTVSVKMIYSS
jgi:hypothetical protein